LSSANPGTDVILGVPRETRPAYFKGKPEAMFSGQ